MKRSVQERIEQIKRHPRVCHECGKPMTTGFCIDNGAKYYCSQECLSRNYTPQQWNDIYADGNSDSYYTEWDEDAQ